MFIFNVNYYNMLFIKKVIPNITYHCLLGLCISKDRAVWYEFHTAAYSECCKQGVFCIYFYDLQI